MRVDFQNLKNIWWTPKIRQRARVCFQQKGGAKWQTGRDTARKFIQVGRPRRNQGVEYSVRVVFKIWGSLQFVALPNSEMDGRKAKPKKRRRRRRVLPVKFEFLFKNIIRTDAIFCLAASGRPTSCILLSHSKFVACLLL